MIPTKHSLEKVRIRLKELNLDGLLISNQANITYLTGFPSRESYLLLSASPESKKANYFITDFRYLEEAKKHLKDFSVKLVNGSVFTLIAELSLKCGFERLGFEAKYLSYAEYKKLKTQLESQLKFIPTFDLIAYLRQIKNSLELKKIKKAIEITILAFNYARKIIKPGMKECELAINLEHFIKAKGADSSSFDTIVASGPNSSYPHHLTSKRRFKRNEPVLIDMGVTYEGYKSDLTRVFFLGTISPEIVKVYDTILRAQAEAIKYITCGVPISKVDHTARQYIAQEGYGGYFGHSLGHGIGLEVHEEPHISSKNNSQIMSGMVFTVEPAVYLPDNFGLRVEDMVLVTEKGTKRLSGNLDQSIKKWSHYLDQ